MDDIKAAFTRVPRACSLCGAVGLGGGEHYSKAFRKLLWLCMKCRDSITSPAPASRAR